MFFDVGVVEVEGVVLEQEGELSVVGLLHLQHYLGLVALGLLGLVIKIITDTNKDNEHHETALFLLTNSVQTNHT